MIYELRRYESAPGKLGSLIERYDGFTTDCMRRHGIGVVGLWKPMIGNLDELYVMLSHDSLAERERTWPNLVADQDRIDVFKESERDGPLVIRRQSQLLMGTPKSPLR